MSTTWRFDAIGTAWSIDADEPLEDRDRAAVADRIAAFDRTWSRFRDDSLVAELDRRPGVWTMPPEAVPLLDLYHRLHEVTGGAVSPLVGRTLADLGYDAQYSLRADREPSAVPSWSSVEWRPPELTTREPLVLDVGAAGKGLLVDLVVDLLSDYSGLTVDASGDLVHSGSSPLRVALEHPLDPSVAVGVVELRADGSEPESGPVEGDVPELAPPLGHGAPAGVPGPGRRKGTALCASAVNRRAWGDGLHHVLDARTGRPTRDVIATWVVAESCMLADGAATAAFFVAPDLLDEALGVASARLLSNGRLEWSARFPGEMFT